MSKQTNSTGFEIAVIGMAGRFPGAANIGEYWENLVMGKESISFFSHGELLEAGVEKTVLENPNYVKANGFLEGNAYFDSSFFGYTDVEARLMDPQTRIFHECAWASLEDAGYCPADYNGLIGLYVGASRNFEWEAQTLFSSDTDRLGRAPARLLTDKDFLGGWVAYKLDLKGPSFTMATACSTSLAAIHEACQAVLNGECDMALAGGAAVTLLNKTGYMYTDGLPYSPDGHVHAFDAGPHGIMGGNGVSVVVLKQLEDALQDRDHIYAVIKGSAINNDGINKAGFTAPGIDGQARVIKAALEMAEVEPESIGYVETHGTGTELGDPVEIQALKLAFNTDKRQYCRIGSVKTNIGHLDAAAGAAGLIKAALCIKHKLIPPSLHFKRPNPNIDFENSPFYVNAQLSEWRDESNPLRAGVSSFGLGGTNAHVILEEAPPPEPSSRGRPFQLLLLSANTMAALDRNTRNLALHLGKNPGINLVDAAYTLQTGRQAFQYRRMLLCSNREEAIRSLSSPEEEGLQTRKVPGEKRSLVFMFSGQGSLYVNMGLDLYNREPQFREEVDRCFSILESLSESESGFDAGLSFKDILYPSAGGLGAAKKGMNDPRYNGALTLLFEYSLAKLLMKWGLEPDAMVGYSFGEYTTACLADVFSLEDVLKLTLQRGKMMLRMPVGSMMSVSLPEKELQQLLPGDISIAAVNGPEFCIVSGPPGPIKRLRDELRTGGHDAYRFRVFRAGHSRMMVPFKEEFITHFESVRLEPPKIPYISGLTGTWITRRQAVSPEYWARHMTETIRFADGVSVLIKELDPVFIQPGSDRGIPLYVNQNPLIKEENIVLNMIRHQKEKRPDTAYLLDKIGHSWSSGVYIHWNAFYNDEKRNRIPLPAYSFERTSYPSSGNIHEIRDRLLSGEYMPTRRKDMEDWVYIPVWEQSFFAKEYTPGSLSGSSWLVFLQGEGPGKEIVRRLRRFARIIIVVVPGKTFEKTGELEFTVNPGNPGDYDALLEELSKTREIPQRVLHLWNLDEYKTGETILHELDQTQDLGLYSLLNLVKALGNRFITNDLRLDIVTCCMQEVTGEEKLFPVQATVLGAVKIIPLEYRNIFCRSIDMEIDTPIDLLMRELCIDSPDKITALRGNQRWLQNVKAVRLEETGIPGGHRCLVEKGVYLITGGLGGLGFTFARHLARNCKARLILIDTAEFPARETWDTWIADNGEQDSISRKILEIRELEKGDAEFLVYNADVSDYPAMKQIVKEAEKHTSRINGVIHTAGLLDYEGAIQKRTREMTEKLLAAKVKGTLVLDEILKEKQLDFWVFSSSLGNILYGVKFGQVGYNAGHEFLDVFARYKQKQGTRAVTIDWTDWLEVGMILEFTERLGEEKYRVLGQDDPFCITPAEGVEVFLRILQSPLPQAAVSPLDLHAMMKYQNNPKSSREIPGEKFENESPLPMQKKQKRPSLNTQYAPPRDEAERKAAEIFQQFFEVERVGIYDDFYEMGGDSLKAVQLASLMKKSGIPIHFHQLLLHRNIDEICRNLAQKGKTGMDMENIELYLSRKYNTAVYYRAYPYGGLSCRVLFIAGESFEIRKVLENIGKITASGTVIYPDFVVFIASGVLAPEPEDIDDDGMAELLGLKDSLNEDDRYKMLEELNKNNRFTLLLKRNARIRQYEVSPVQKFYLLPPFKEISTNFGHFFYDFLYPVDYRKIQDIVAALVQKNSLLRSVIVDREGNYFIEEFESFSNIQLPLIDISSYSGICKIEITSGIVQHLHEPLDVLDNVLFRAAILKVNHTHYRLLIIFNHLIADGTSIGILETQLRDLSGDSGRSGETREKTNLQRDYCDYVQFLKIQDYKNIQLENYVNLQEYSRSLDEILKKFKVRGLEHESFELDISIIEEKNKAYYNEIVMFACAAIIRDLFGVSKVPLSYVSNGRVYGGGDFNHIIGDFHDLVPVLFSRDEDPRAAIERFQEYKRFIRKNNLNFINFAVKGYVTVGGVEQLQSPFGFNSLVGSYQFLKERRSEQAEKMVEASKISHPYFFIGVLEDFNAGKLWISFLHNSGFNVKEAFMKNYSHLVSSLNQTNEVNANRNKEEHK